MKRMIKWPLFLIAIPWAVIMMLIQTVHGGGGMRGGDPAYPGSRLGNPGGGTLTPANTAANPATSIRTVVTDLTPDQQTSLTTAATAINTRLLDWQNSSQAALQPLAAGSDAYNAELYKQNLLREDILNEAEVGMLAILTPAQAELWETSRLTTQLNTRLGILGLTDAQSTKIKTMIADAAKKLAAAKDKDALVKTRAEFWKQVAGLLTDIQTDQIFAPTFTTPGARGRGAGAGGAGGFGGGAPTTTP